MYWFLVSGGQINQNDQQSGVLMEKFVRRQQSIEIRGGYYQERILHGSLIFCTSCD